MATTPGSIFEGSQQLGVLLDRTMVHNVESVVDVTATRTCLQLYMGVLLGQYVAVFCLVPFESVENRPGINVAAIMLSLITVSVADVKGSKRLEVYVRGPNQTGSSDTPKG